MDLRQHNTQERIVAGLVECLETKPFRELENKDIYNKAGITYRTFFRYYSDKNDLLNDLEKTLINGLQSALAQDRNSLTHLKHEPDQDEILILADPAFKTTLHFCDKYKRTLRALVSENGDILFVRKIEAVAETEFKIRAKYLAGNKNLEIQDTMFIKIYVSQIMTLIENWLFFSDNISQANLKKVIGCVQIMSPFEILKIEAKMS